MAVGGKEYGAQVRSIVCLEEVKVHPALAVMAEHYREAATVNEKLLNTVRRDDLRRWSFVMSLLGDGRDFLDIGIGAGQLVNTVASLGTFARVRGADRRSASNLFKMNENWSFLAMDVAGRIPRGLEADVVTCLQCLQYVRPDRHQAALLNLMSLSRKRLLITVPFNEDTEGDASKSTFTITRLANLLPRGKVILMSSKRTVRWALVQWDRSDS